MYIAIKSDKVDRFLVSIGTTVRYDRQVYEVTMCEMYDESRAGYPIRERTTTDKASAMRTYNYYRKCARNE